jgi:TonB-dependent SusC/RagA subfamily outer membrane receptor
MRPCTAKSPGANIVANSGAPGGGISMKLRGITTITGSSEPLYIVDGVYMDNSAIPSGINLVTAASRASGATSTQDNPSNRIADLNPADIENIEVLKGPSAAAIYGARANAGVVIITTKRGKGGKTNISFNQDIGRGLGPQPAGHARLQRRTRTGFFREKPNWPATRPPAPPAGWWTTKRKSTANGACSPTAASACRAVPKKPSSSCPALCRTKKASSRIRASKEGRSAPTWTTKSPTCSTSPSTPATSTPSPTGA